MSRREIFYMYNEYLKSFKFLDKVDRLNCNMKACFGVKSLDADAPPVRETELWTLRETGG